MTIFRFKPTYIKGRKQRPVLTALWYAFAILAVAAFFFGPFYLAQQLYDVDAPTGDQIRAARALIAAVIVAPFAAGVAWMWWQSRGAEGAWVRRRTEMRIDDPSKHSRADQP